MKKLNDSFVFRELIASNSLSNKIKNIDLNRDYVAPSRISAIDTLNKKFNFPLKNEVLNFVKQNKIKIIFNKDNAFPRYMNTIVRKDSMNNKAYAIVDITNFASVNMNISYNEVDEEGRPIEILPKILYTFLLNAAISIIVADNNKNFEYATNLHKLTSMSYTKMVCKIFDKMMGIGINDERSDVVHFLVAKFFLISVIGLEENENTEKIALLSCYNNTSYDFLKTSEQDLRERPAVKEYPYSNIFNFFIMLKEVSTLEKLNFRGFMEQWLRMYGEATMLAVDYFPSFVSLCFATEVSAGLNRDYIIDNVAGRINRKIIEEFCKLV